MSTWHVEGLTDLKLHQICAYMQMNNIGICCMQETGRKMSDHYVTEDDSKVILSGSSGSAPEWAGVGFIVSPKLSCYIEGFCQVNSRIANIKLKVDGGTIVIFCVYAQHNLKDLGDRFEFYEQLSRIYLKTSSNGPKLVFGDFNARIGNRRPGEELVLGEFCFGKEAVHKVEVPNRDLLFEFCVSPPATHCQHLL